MGIVELMSTHRYINSEDRSCLFFHPTISRFLTLPKANSPPSLPLPSYLSVLLLLSIPTEREGKTIEGNSIFLLEVFFKGKRLHQQCLLMDAWQRRRSESCKQALVRQVALEFQIRQSRVSEPR